MTWIAMALEGGCCWTSCQFSVTSVAGVLFVFLYQDTGWLNKEQTVWLVSGLGRGEVWERGGKNDVILSGHILFYCISILIQLFSLCYNGISLKVYFDWSIELFPLNISLVENFVKF